MKRESRRIDRSTATAVTRARRPNAAAAGIRCHSACAAKSHADTATSRADNARAIARLSALDFDQKKIQAPSWGRSEEAQFLPLRLTPNLTWTNVIFPYGHLSGAFDISQNHRTFAETKQIETPAGRFDSCIRIETQAQYEGGTYAQKGKQLRLTYLDWYAPNVGLIRTLALEGGPTGPEMERVELVRFKVTPVSAQGELQ